VLDAALVSTSVGAGGITIDRMRSIVVVSVTRAPSGWW
jgi:hypothetical protein